MENIKEALDAHYAQSKPSTIVFEVVGAMALLLVSKYILFNATNLKDKIVSGVFKGLKNIPGVQGQLDKEKDKIKKMAAEKFKIEGDKLLVLPQKGISHEEILRKMEELRFIEEKRWKSGKLSGVIYGGDEKHVELMNRAYSMFSLTNPLHPDVFPGVRKFEAEIVQMTIHMMNGDNKVCGSLTSGGTESIIMAVKAYRDFYNKSKPNIVIPVTAHPAFDKAASYFGIEVNHIPVDKDGNVSPKAMEAAINKNTIMMCGSAPEFSHGIVDPIPQLAAIAQKYGIGFHSDCCLGGFILPWVQKAGIDGGKIPLFDFRVPGVTSMSVDTHKYGYSTKGTSVVLFRNEELRRKMFFVQPNWPGGVYASPTMAGSRSGGLIACCWASLVAIGQEGFLNRSKNIWMAAQKIKEGIKKIPELELIGDSSTQVVAWQSSSVDILKVGDAMSSKGWSLNMLQYPPGLHICCTSKHVDLEETFLDDLRDCVAIVKNNPNAFPDGMAPMYGMAASFPDRSVIADVGLTFVEAILEP